MTCQYKGSKRIALIKMMDSRHFGLDYLSWNYYGDLNILESIPSYIAQDHELVDKRIF